MEIDYNTIYEALRINSLSLIKLLIISYFIFYWLPSKIFPQDHMNDLLDKILFNALYSLTFALLVIPQLILLKIFSIPLYIIVLLLTKILFIIYYEKRDIREIFANLKKSILVNIFDFFDNYSTFWNTVKKRQDNDIKNFISKITLYKFFLRSFYLIVFSYAVLNIAFNSLITFTDGSSDMSFYISWVGFLKENVLWSDLNTFGAVMYGIPVFVFNLALWTNIDSIILFKIYPVLLILAYFFVTYYVLYKMFKSRYTALFGVIVTSLIFYSPLGNYFSGYEFAADSPLIKTFFDKFSFYYIENNEENIKEAVMYANIPYNRFFSGLGYEFSCTMFLLNIYFLIQYFDSKKNINLLLYCLTLFTVFTFHGGGALFLLPASLLILFNAIIFWKITFKVLWQASIAVFITSILGNLWTLAMIKYGLLLDVGDALPILDELLGTKKQAITATQTGKESMYLIIFTSLQYIMMGLTIFVAIVTYFIKKNKFLMSSIMLAVIAVFIVFYLPHFGVKRLVSVQRGLEYLILAQVVMLTYIFYFINLGFKKILKSYYTRVALPLFYSLFFIGVISFPKWHNAEDLPPYAADILYPKNVEMISYSAGSKIILDINKLYRPFSWTLISYVQEYSKAKDHGYHVNTQNFLLDYDPTDYYLKIPTEYIFIIEEIVPNSYKGKNEWRYRWRREVADNLRSWIALYSSKHDNMRLFSSGKNINVYIIENKEYLEYLSKKEKANR